MFGIGTTELLIILVIILLLFGSSKLPELGRGLGQGLRGFRDAMPPALQDRRDHAETLAIVLPGVWEYKLAQKRAKLEQFGRRVWKVKSARAAITRNPIACRRKSGGIGDAARGLRKPCSHAVAKTRVQVQRQVLLRRRLYPVRRR